MASLSAMNGLWISHFGSSMPEQEESVQSGALATIAAWQ
jgi:hypothetical protein